MANTYFEPLVVVKRSGMKNAYQQQYIIKTRQFEQQLNRMSQEELYEFILSSHNDMFKLSNGRTAKEMLLEKSWGSISQNPGIPHEIRAAWAAKPVAERGRAIAHYQEICNKLEDALGVMLVTAASSPRSLGSARSIMESITVHTQWVLRQIQQSLATGKDVSIPDVTSLVRQSLESQSASVDRNSEAFAYYEIVMKKFDPQDNVWVNC
jgi:hypothetical protein